MTLLRYVKVHGLAVSNMVSFKGTVDSNIKIMYLIVVSYTASDKGLRSVPQQSKLYNVVNLITLFQFFFCFHVPDFATKGI